MRIFSKRLFVILKNCCFVSSVSCGPNISENVLMCDSACSKDEMERILFDWEMTFVFKLAGIESLIYFSFDCKRKVLNVCEKRVVVNRESFIQYKSWNISSR